MTAKTDGADNAADTGAVKNIDTEGNIGADIFSAPYENAGGDSILPGENAGGERTPLSEDVEGDNIPLGDGVGGGGIPPGEDTGGSARVPYTEGAVGNADVACEKNAVSNAEVSYKEINVDNTDVPYGKNAVDNADVPYGKITVGSAGESRGNPYDLYSKEKINNAVLWTAFLTAVFTSVVLIIFLRIFGLITFSGAVDFRGTQRSVASVQKLQQVWDALSQDFYLPVDGDRMIEYAAAGMAGSLGDVYTTYYTSEEMRRFTEHSSGIFQGIGVYILQGANGRLRVSGFLENSPALEAGVQIDDEIINVDGVDVDGVTDSNIIIDMIKGEAGIAVTIGFYRPSDAAVHEFTIERREIKAENIFSKILYSGDESETGADPIGYIYIQMFDSAAAEYFNLHLDKLLESGIMALVIDLRGNPGGDFDQTVKIADRLIEQGVIVYTEDRSGKREYKESDDTALGLPIRVLIDGDSASASEILAGAIKDSGAGRLIGAKTFGKGLVQAVIPLRDGSGLKYTRSRYYTPSGQCIDGIGIEPDINVEPTGRGGSALTADNPQNNDIVLNAALSDIMDIEFAVDKAKYE